LITQSYFLTFCATCSRIVGHTCRYLCCEAYFSAKQ
jgi:hypothetical protein